MKKILFALLLISASAFSQENEKPAFKPSTVIKWSPASLYFGKLSFGSELHLWKKRAITLNVGIPMKREGTFDLDGQDRKADIQTTSVMAGYRMYLGKADITGFYFEPYLKYVKNEAGIDRYTTTINGRSADFEMRSNYSGFGLGAQLGVQFMIAKTVTFDMFLLGPEANMSKETMTFRETSGTIPWTLIDANDAKRELQEAVEDIPIIGKKIEIDVNQAAKTVTGKYDGFLPGIRAGISVGIRF